MSEERHTASGGIGFVGALTLLFVGLKLTGHIDWSWWWVLSPSIVAVVLWLVIVVVGVVLLTSRGRR